MTADDGKGKAQSSACADEAGAWLDAWAWPGAVPAAMALLSPRHPPERWEPGCVRLCVSDCATPGGAGSKDLHSATMMMMRCSRPGGRHACEGMSSGKLYPMGSSMAMVACEGTGVHAVACTTCRYSLGASRPVLACHSHVRSGVGPPVSQDDVSWQRTKCVVQGTSGVLSIQGG